MDVGGADFMMVPRSVGYIKQVTPVCRVPLYRAVQTGDGLAGPPVIVYNHRSAAQPPHLYSLYCRRVLPGRLEPLLEAQQAFADYMYEVEHITVHNNS